MHLLHAEGDLRESFNDSLIGTPKVSYMHDARCMLPLSFGYLPKIVMQTRKHLRDWYIRFDIVHHL